MDYRHISGRSISGRVIGGRSIGMRVSGGGRAGESEPTPPLSPSLTWVGDESDNIPDFDIDLPSGNGAPYDAAEDDVLRLQYSSDNGGNWNAYLTRTLTVDDISGDPFTVNGIGVLANGDYLFRARIERGSLVSSWSDSEYVNVAVPAIGRNVILLMRAR